MLRNKLLFFTVSFTFFSIPLRPNMPERYSFKKVIIWGHKLHSHTHSYIHYAFHKTFKHLGYDTYWFDAKDNVSNFDFSNSLFITESQADKNIPLRQDCRYILHNCVDTKYKKLRESGNCITLQVYTHDALKNHKEINEMAPFVMYNLQDKTIYMPWATDLLPHEIDHMKTLNMKKKKEKAIYWIGTGSAQIDELKQACKKYNIEFKNIDPWTKPASPEENIAFTQKSLFAPAIQSQWQCDNGYIPCRIFKNISYGQMGVTNSATVNKLFHNKIVFNPNIKQLFIDALQKIKTMSTQELHELMDFVRDHHTYINRIECLLRFMNMIKPIKGNTHE